MCCCVLLNSEAQVISTIVGNGVAGFSGDGGQAVFAQLDSPSDVVLDKYGNLYIADRNNSRIRKVDTSGIITTIAGNGGWGFSGDNGPALSATLGRPTSIALDSSGNIYFADYDNNRIRKIPTSGIITTIAGNGQQGYSGDGGNATAAKLNLASGITADQAGNVFIADYANNRIRKVSTSGIITTVAGNGTAGLAGDGGPAINAQLKYPSWITVDKYGNLFISEHSGNRIRKVNTSGIISTWAGSTAGNFGFAGDGGPAIFALLKYPAGLRIDNSGNLFFADGSNDRIRKIDSAGRIMTVAGTGTFGYTGDGGPPLAANLGGRSGVAIDSNFDLYLAEAYTNRVRKVEFGIFTDIGTNEKATVQPVLFPNPADASFMLFGSQGEFLIQISDINGKVCLSQTILSNDEVDIKHLEQGVYTVSLANSKLITTKRLVIIR
jgi:hypothetical protein